MEVAGPSRNIKEPREHTSHRRHRIHEQAAALRQRRLDENSRFYATADRRIDRGYDRWHIVGDEADDEEFATLRAESDPGALVRYVAWTKVVGPGPDELDTTVALRLQSGVGSAYQDSGHDIARQFSIVPRRD